MTSFRARSRPSTLVIALSSLASAWLVMDSSSAAAETKTKYETKLTFSPKFYGTDVPPTSQVETPILLEPSMSVKTESGWRFKVAPYIYADPASHSASEQWLFDGTELNAEKHLGDFTVKVGLNQVAWGVTDVYNPLDVASAHRLFDPLNADKRGAPSLQVSYDGGDWRAEALYIPYQLPSILPGDKSRWLPRDIAYLGANRDEPVILSSEVQYHYQDNNEVDGALHNNFGGRLELHKSGIDLSGIFFQGAPTAPNITIHETDDLTWNSNGVLVPTNININLRPDYYIRRTVGGSAVVTLGSYIVKFESVYSDRVSANVNFPGWAQANVLGVEKGVSIGSGTLTILGQATYGRHEINSDNSITSIDTIFDESVLLGLRLATEGEWVFNLAGLKDFENRGSFLQAKVEKKISDGVTGSLEGEVIDGPDGTTLGSYRHNNRLGLGLSLFF